MANQTSSEVIQKSTIEIDQQFSPPPNVIDVVQQKVIDVTQGQDQSADDASDEILDATDPGNVEYATLPSVDAVTVVSQTVKTTTGGAITVDVIIEVLDYDGILEYDVRVTKI